MPALDERLREPQHTVVIRKGPDDVFGGRSADEPRRVVDPIAVVSEGLGPDSFRFRRWPAVLIAVQSESDLR
jgi:hypothetical protein